MLQIASKKAAINPPHSTNSGALKWQKDSDFSKVAHYQAKRLGFHKNIEKLSYLLQQGNYRQIRKSGQCENSLLYQKNLSAVAMKDNQVITDIITNKPQTKLK